MILSRILIERAHTERGRLSFYFCPSTIIQRKKSCSLNVCHSLFEYDFFCCWDAMCHSCAYCSASDKWPQRKKIWIEYVIKWPKTLYFNEITAVIGQIDVMSLLCRHSTLCLIIVIIVSQFSELTHTKQQHFYSLYLPTYSTETTYWHQFMLLAARSIYFIFIFHFSINKCVNKREESLARDRKREWEPIQTKNNKKLWKILRVPI